MSIVDNDYTYTRNSSKDLVWNNTTNTYIPENLYAWSWTPQSTQTGANITTCYTISPTPTSSDNIYYANGITISNNTYFYSGIGGTFYTTNTTPITNVTNNSITLTGDGTNMAAGGSND